MRLRFGFILVKLWEGFDIEQINHKIREIRSAMHNNSGCFVDKSAVMLGGVKSFAVAEDIWRESLENALPDPVAQIRHAVVGGEAAWRVHVAEIQCKVACHAHFAGEEQYEIVSGAGKLHYGPVITSAGAFQINWQKPLAVKAGDTFLIPEGYAHQLVREGNVPLIILFACPDSHLGNDRTVLAEFCPDQNGC